MTRSVSQRLLAANRDVWEAMQAHRFVCDIEQDRLPDDVFARYLVFEHRFVETAILIFGHAMMKAPGIAQRRWLIGVLHALSTAQLTSFEAAFAALGVRAAPPGAALPPAVVAFDRGMLRMAEDGDFDAVLTIMLAAEWMYATWCGRAADRPISSPELRRWVMLHAAPDFLAQAAWLRAQIDATIPDAAAFARMSALFRRALELEIGFHDAAYDTSWTPPLPEEIA